jgi:RNA polymerase sigma-70 factor (ECF subfamily)
MSDESRDRPLDRISTLWSVVCRAHTGTPLEAAQAHRLLLLRYGEAVRRYLLGAVRDPEVADDLFQEFSLRLLRGDLKGADRERGRFRQFVKGVLSHLIADHHRQRSRSRQAPEDADELADLAAAPADTDLEFLDGWREQVLQGAWQALDRVERATGQPFFTVLRLRVDRPELSSGDMAEELTRRLGHPVSSAWVRQNLHRAREKYADLLVEEVAQTLESPRADDLERELIELDLYEYCRASAARYRAALSAPNAEKV